MKSEWSRRSQFACVERIVELEDQLARLRDGNTKLLDALMGMVDEFFVHHGASGAPDEDGEILTHSYMNAEEQAIDTLIAAGMAEEALGGGYRLLWEKLKARQGSDSAIISE